MRGRRRRRIVVLRGRGVIGARDDVRTRWVLRERSCVGRRTYGVPRHRRRRLRSRDLEAQRGPPARGRQVELRLVRGRRDVEQQRAVRHDRRPADRGTVDERGACVRRGVLALLRTRCRSLFVGLLDIGADGGAEHAGTLLPEEPHVVPAGHRGDEPVPARFSSPLLHVAGAVVVRFHGGDETRDAAETRALRLASAAAQRGDAGRGHAHAQGDDGLRGRRVVLLGVEIELTEWPQRRSQRVVRVAPA
mmetsp:Transcript_44258/g.136617  ORF Transcript_44258/g.136617 Transcript_44258/m.136617 type:complete len:248 (+) Transcript_44258:426-1169(+)